MKRSAVTTSPQGNEWLPTTKTNLSAAGNSQGTATAIPSGQDLSIFTTVAASTGASLPGSGVSLGEEYCVANHGANALSVYPASNGQVGTTSVNTAYSLTSGKTGYFVMVGPIASGGYAWTANP